VPSRIACLSTFFSNFMHYPFQTIDNLDLHWHGFQLNLLRDDEKLRKAIFQIFFLIPLILWLLLGVDSTADQVAYFLFSTPSFLLHKITLIQWLNVYNRWYGLGTHWSASVIYSLLLIGISKHLHDKLDVKNSINLCISASVTGLSIASFEFFWQASYAYWQNQWWVLWFKFPQARILIQNMLFAIMGILFLIALNWKEYKLNFDRITVLSFIATIGLVFLWWFFPFPVTRLVVGKWVSSTHFPQSMYTIQTNPHHAIGKLFYVGDTGVHLVNNVCKISMTAFFYSLFKIKERC
jgi:hypothetical protein